MSDLTWFRAPTDDHPGTLNACYHALDLPVIRGQADEDAVVLAGTARTYAWMLTEVGACAGVLRAFGVGVGDTIRIGTLPSEIGVLAALAGARVGAILDYGDAEAQPGMVTLTSADEADEDGVAFVVDGDAIAWDVAMRAGRTDPAGVADVPGDAVFARCGEAVLSVLEVLGASDDQKSALPPGATLIEIGGAQFWSFDTPG